MTLAETGPVRPGPVRPGLRHAASWTGAVLGALILNLVLFGLMPGLVNRTPQKHAVADIVPMVNIVRLKRPEPPAQRQPRTQKQKTPEPARVEKQVVSPPQIPRKRLTLPFKVNPALPAGPLAVPVLPMETVSVKAPALKPFYDTGEIDAGLRPLSKVPPLYPPRARRRGIEGWVKVSFLVNEEGRVEGIDVIAAEPKNVFEKSVIQCVSAWRFTPGKVAGVPVKTRAETTIRFELK